MALRSFDRLAAPDNLSPAFAGSTLPPKLGFCAGVVKSG
jgi:hypothetical protein